MADVGLRELGSFVARGRREEPSVAPPGSASLDVSAGLRPDPARAEPRQAASQRHEHEGIDALGLDATLAQLAEVAADARTTTPTTIALAGAAGSGKSVALRRLSARIRALSAAAGTVAGSPFLKRIHVQPIDAAGLGDDPLAALAMQLHRGLQLAYPDFARELVLASRDPQVALRDANEKLDEARRRLDVERRALDDAGARRARLTESVLYEASGSQVDAYARANRAGIENRLTGFGVREEPIRAFKDYVQFAAGSNGRTMLALRALWAFKGQGKLIVAAVVLVAAGIGLGIAIDDQSRWLAELRTNAQTGTPVANWFEAHMELLGTVRFATFVLAGLAVLANLYRAFTFLQPIFKGARLLVADLDARRRDLDSLYAHQTKRVDTLDRDVERLTQDVAEAERRAGNGGHSASAMPSLFEEPVGGTKAHGFFAELPGALGAAHAPQRLVFALDHVDALEPQQASRLLDALHRTIGSSAITLIALDPDRFATSHGALERWIDIPLRLDARGTRDDAALVRHALGRGGKAGPEAAIDAKSSVVDRPIGEDEIRLLTELSALAGGTPRATTRFASRFAVARHETGIALGALALMLALHGGGTDAERSATEQLLAEGEASAPFAPAAASPRLAAAIASTVSVTGPITVAEARAAAARAALFSLRR